MDLNNFVLRQKIFLLCAMLGLCMAAPAPQFGLGLGLPVLGSSYGLGSGYSSYGLGNGYSNYGLGGYGGYGGYGGLSPYRGDIDLLFDV